MRILLILLTIINVNSQLNAQIFTSNKQKIIWAHGKSCDINQQKYYWIPFSKEVIYFHLYTDKNKHSRRDFDPYKIQIRNNCVEYWVKERLSGRTVLIQLCENEIYPFIKMTRYINGKAVKKTIYYLD